MELMRTIQNIARFPWHKKCTVIRIHFLVVVNVHMAQDSYDNRQDRVLTTQESCAYLRITKPTYFKYIREGRINATKAGKGWKVLKSELRRFLRGDQ
ncbi:MAG: helix-turn-helix domain-containing protein [Thermodesulfobacteriota bacterium]